MTAAIVVSADLMGLTTTVLSLVGHDPEQYFQLLVAAVFVSSVLCLVFAVRRSADPRVRRAFVAVFFVGLLVVNLVPLPSLLPFTHMHKYTQTSSNPTGYYEIHLLDENGDELRYDGEAARPAGTLNRFARGIATEYDEASARSTANYLLDRGVAYRQAIEDGRGVGHRFAFPPHALGHRWDEASLAEYDEFVGVRIYHVELRYAASGLDVAARNRTVVAELTPSGALVRDGAAR